MSTRNGYFQIRSNNSGTFLLLFPPVDGGEAIRTAELTEYLSIKGIMYDLMEVDRLVKSGQQVEHKLSGDEIIVERESMVISVSADKMKATIRFYPPFEGGEIMSEQEILSDLQFNKIIYGVNRELIKSFVADRHYCTDFVVAEGLPMVEGVDAHIEYLFNTDLSQKPAVNEDGSVDYFHLETICHCEKGDVLAQMITAIPGKDGFNVHGERAIAQIPRNVLFQYGKNISKSEDGKQLIADINGHVTLVDGKVFVSGTLELTDVDTSTGNIEYDGNVLVSGNVQSGFEINAKGDVEVRGVVEGAKITAGGQIIINRGITGMSRGVLTAGSNVIVKYIENATVHAGGYVETDCIIHSTVTAGSHVTVQGKRGFITGGVVRATSYVEVKTLGSDMGVDTTVEVGTDPEMKARYNELQQEVQEMRKNIARLEPVIRAVGEKLGKGEKLNLDQMKQAKLLSTQLATNKEKLKSDLVELAKLEVSFDQTTDASVKITGQAYPGTKIVVSECKLVLKTPYHYCKFIREGADVIMKAL